MVSLFDPFGVVVPTTRAVVKTGFQMAIWTERQVLGALRSRLDVAAPQRPPLAIAGNSKSGQEELFHKIIDQLVPDEARIIGALSDGSVSPMLHVFARTVTGAGEAILENAALVGKMANVSVPQLTPVYVGHLLSLGLLETGPEDPTLKNDYQILGADSAVLRALKQGKRGPLEARVERYTIRLTQLGRDLWEEATTGGLM
jgi:hypothetical protein